MRNKILILTALLGGALSSSATVTVQGWWHLDSTQPITDSSGNSRTFGEAYSTAPGTGGQFAAEVIPNGAGGPLDSSGWTSTECIRVGIGVGGKRQSAMWAIGYNPPATNYGIEIWVMPQDNGIAGGSGGWIFSSGQGGGVALRINTSATNSYIDAFVLGSNPTVEIGNPVLIDTNRWMHLAIVNDSGNLTFYTNGIPTGPPVLATTNTPTVPSGDVYIGTPSDNSAYYGFLDEARMFTFAAGAFSTNDLLLRSSPNILYSPASITVWNGGAAPFSVTASFDDAITYQWYTGGAAISGATTPFYLLAVATGTNSGTSYDCEVTLHGVTVTSTPPAVVTVVTNNASDVAAYRNLITAEPSLIAYFPVDNCTGAVLTNVADATRTHDGEIDPNATYTGATNSSFGQRALFFNENGDVQVPNNPAYEFPSGNGTIEAAIYMNGGTVDNPAIFSENFDGDVPYYALFAAQNGSGLIYSNDNATLTWNIPGGLIGEFAHIALVFNNGTNVTPYVNGLSLGTQVQPSFGSTPGGQLWFGSIGQTTTSDRWAGTIDEVAVYSAALSGSDIQAHFTKFHFGTNVAPPVVMSQPASKTLYAGGSPTLTVAVSGALPISYQWTSNSIPIPGATSASLVLTQATTAFSATYSCTITNVFGPTATQPIALTFTTPPAGYVADVMSLGPVGFWRLADTAGPTAVDSAGMNDATYTSGGVTYAVGGAPGDTTAGVKFDGSTGRAATPANYPDINPSGPFSVEFWAALTSYGFYVPMGSMDRPGRTGGYEYYIDGNSSGYEFHTAEAGGYSLLCADNNVPPNGVWAYVVGVWDGTNLYLYVNGVLGNDQIDPPAPAGTDNFTAEGLGQTEFIPNTVAPFIIGSRDDNTHYFKGTMADVAVYPYALSYTQITNHWSFAWTPAQVTQSPVGVTNIEGSTVTLTATATGLPNTYAWYKGSTPLTYNAENSDLSAHYPNGVSNLTLTISQAVPADSGLFHLEAFNPVGNALSASAQVTIYPDTNPPAVSLVQVLGTPNTSLGPTPFLLKVGFNKRVNALAATTTGNYAISGSVSVSAANIREDTLAESLGSDWKEVILQTSGFTPGQQYTLSVSNIQDQATTPVTMQPAVITFFAPPLQQGYLYWDFYDSLPQPPNPTVDSLLADLYFPSQPTTNWYFTAFDSDQVTGGDLNNNPAFGSLGDYYGDSVSGWITPTNTDSYTFFLAADDEGEIDLSPDANPAHAQPIATLATYTAAFQDPNSTNPPPQTSSPQALTAGTPYFIRALHVEITGGDWVKVAWRGSADTTPAAQLKPIPGQFFSSYVLLPPQFGSPSFSQGKLTLNWTGLGALYQSSDLKTWTLVAGNPASGYQVTPTPGQPHLFYQVRQ